MDKEQKTNYLQHYGVRGMRWGVRRGNIARAYMKADRKRIRLTKKAAKVQYKGSKKVANATSVKKHTKGNKILFKAAKLNKKAEKWTRKMEKEFSTKKLTDVSVKQKRKGERYVNRAIKIENKRRRNRLENKSQKRLQKANQIDKFARNRDEVMADYYRKMKETR